MADFATGVGGATAPIQSEVVASLNHDYSADAVGVPRALYIDSAQSITYVTANGETITKAGLAVGIYHPIRAKKVTSGTVTLGW